MFESERTFAPGEARLDGKEIVRARLVGRVRATVSRAKVTSSFEVESRGRVMTLRLDVGKVLTSIDVVTLPPTQA